MAPSPSSAAGLRSRAAGIVAAIPDLGIAAAALLTWVDPSILGTELVRGFVMLMLVEFIVVHSSAFLGAVAYSEESAWRRVRNTVLISLFYTVFLAGFALSFKTWWPILGFWGLTLNRLLGVLIGQAPSGQEKALLMQQWGIGAAAYILCVFPTVVLPLPRLGVTRSMLGELSGDTSGVWVSEPHRAVAFAMLYFGIVGLLQMKGLSSKLSSDATASTAPNQPTGA